jgi:protein O-GlcNAc transferase
MTDLEAHLDQLFDAARQAFGENRHAVVVELLSPYVRHRTRHGWGHYLLGESLRNLGLFQEAERQLLIADRFPDNRPRSKIRLGNLCQSFGDYAQAERWYAKAVQHPKAADWGWVWILRGGNLARTNQLAAAEECHRHALTLSDTDHDEAWLNIGLVLRAAGKYTDAIDAFKKALELTPDYPEAREALDSLNGITEAVALAQSTPAPAPET